MDWKSRLRNKAFWVSLFSAVLLIVQQLGLNIFPDNVQDIFNAVLGLLTIMGVIIDPSTPGVTDK